MTLRGRRVLIHVQHLAADASITCFCPHFDRGPVFIDATGGFIRHPNFRERFFLPMLRKAGVPIVRLYDLRHTSATLLLAADVNIKVVSQRLGHEDIAITLQHYVHALPSMQDRAVAALQEIYNPTAIPQEEKSRKTIKS
jgi:integrase